jgi:branched-chain amino acid transport system substrate-binding protein
MRNRSRIKRFLAGAGCVVASAALIACGGKGGGGGDDTLVLGVPLGFTGAIAEQAEQMRHSFELWMEENDNTVGGVPVELKFEDSQSDPNMVVQKTRKLIQNDQVDMMAGGALAFESLAIKDQVEAAKMAYVSPHSSADDLTQRKRSPLVVRTNMTSSQPVMPFAEWVYNELGYKKIALVAQDYAYGWETAGGFQYAFEKSGGEIATKIWVPLDASDWAPFVRQIPKDVDAVFAAPVGAGVPRFIKAYKEFGLMGKIPLLGSPDIADEDALDAVGLDAVGIIQPHNYNPNNPETQEYAKAYEEKFGIVPSYWGESPYAMMKWIDAAINAYREENDAEPADVVKWIRDEPEDFIAKMREVGEIEVPRGPVKLDEYGNADENIYVVEVKEENGEPVRETIHTFPMTTQFWNVPAEEFLEQPVFSRTFPK